MKPQKYAVNQRQRPRFTELLSHRPGALDYATLYGGSKRSNRALDEANRYHGTVNAGGGLQCDGHLA